MDPACQSAPLHSRRHSALLGQGDGVIAHELMRQGCRDIVRIGRDLRDVGVSPKAIDLLTVSRLVHRGANRTPLHRDSARTPSEGVHVERSSVIEIPRERRSKVPFTEEQLTAMRGGLTAEEYRWRLIRKWRNARADELQAANAHIARRSSSIPDRSVATRSFIPVLLRQRQQPPPEAPTNPSRERVARGRRLGPSRPPKYTK